MIISLERYGFAKKIIDYELKPSLSNYLNAQMYANSSFVNYKLGFLNEALSDINNAIKISPNISRIKTRAFLKEEMNLNFCADYKIACDLGDQESCKLLNSLCK